MEQSNLKNMVILKDIPSNIIEEAIIILKENKKAKRLEKIETKEGIKKKRRCLLIIIFPKLNKRKRQNHQLIKN